MGGDLVAGRLGRDLQGDAAVGPEAEPEVVRRRRAGATVGEEQAGRAVEGDHRLGGGHGELLARPDEPRHPRPAPRVDLEAQGDEGLGVGPVGDAGLVDVLAVLAPDHLVRIEGPDLAVHLDLLVAQGIGCRRRRRLHGQEGDDLEQVVLHDVAERAGGVEVLGPAGSAELLGHGDLDVGDEVAVPDRLEQGVGEPEHQDVLDPVLAEEVVDAEHRGLGEVPVEHLVELERGAAITPEGLLDHHLGAGVEPHAGEPLDDLLEQDRRDGQVEEGVLDAGQQVGDGAERPLVAVVAADVAEARCEAVPHHRVDVGLGGHGIVRVAPEGLVVPLRRRHPDDGDVEQPARLQAVDGREDLLLGQVAGGPEQHQGVGVADGHQRVPSCTAAAASAATSMIRSSTSSVWARPTKATSYAPGAIATPRSSMAWKSDAYSASSVVRAPS